MHVTPRYLAGHIDDHVGAITEPLLEHGWSTVDDGYDAQVFTSPCLRFRLGWLPEVRGEQPIQITASRHPLAPAAWHIGLDDSIPTECISAVTTVLARTIAANPDDLLTTTPNWATVLLHPAGWRVCPAPQVSATSPDTLARYSAVTRAEHGWEGWAFTAGEPSGRYRWTARLSSTTPRSLVEAFHTALTDPAPLRRNLHDLGPWLFPYITATPVSTQPGISLRSRSGQDRAAVAGTPPVPLPRSHR